MDEDYSFVESNRIPPITPAKDVNVAKSNAVPGVAPEGDLPNEILGPIGREPGIGIAYAEGGVTGKPSPQCITGRSRDDITKLFLIWTFCCLGRKKK